MFSFFKKNACEHEKQHHELQDDEVVVGITYECIGKDRNGKKVNRIVYNNAPKNYQLMYIIEDKETAILRNLDYVVPN